jgi:hypothetical protein
MSQPQQTIEPSNEDRIKELENELAKLKALSNVNTLIDNAKSNLPSIINTPALIDEFKEGQSIAFIHNRQDVVPGIITNINNDNTYNLLVYIPTTQAKIEFDGYKTSFNRTDRIELLEREMLRVRPANPKTIYRKETVALNSPNERGLDGIEQTHVNVYKAVGEASQLRLHEFHTSLVGTFYDPSIYNYKVHCWRAPIEVQGQQFPAEQELFPKKKPFYESFDKAFNRYFKEYHQSRSKSGSKWNRVDIQVFDKD